MLAMEMTHWAPSYRFFDGLFALTPICCIHQQLVTHYLHLEKIQIANDSSIHRELVSKPLENRDLYLIWPRTPI